MKEKKVTHKDIKKAIFQEVGLSGAESGPILDSVFNCIADTLVKGEKVKLTSFGTFAVHQRAPGTRYNPKTKKTFLGGPVKNVSFIPSVTVRTRVAVGNRKKLRKDKVIKSKG